MRRAELLRHVELPVDQVDGDDLGCAGDARALDHADADAPTPEDDDRRAGPHPGRVDRRSHAGRDAAPDQRRDVERDVVGDLDGGVRRDHHLLGERPRSREGEERLIALLEMRDGACRQAEYAELRLTPQAVGTGAARRHPRDDDVVTFRQAAHAVADGDDLAGALVPEHRGDRGRNGAVHPREVGVADTGGGDAHAHLARPGALGGDVVDNVELLVADRSQDCRSHLFAPVSRRRADAQAA